MNNFKKTLAAVLATASLISTLSMATFAATDYSKPIAGQNPNRFANRTTVGTSSSSNANTGTNTGSSTPASGSYNILVHSAALQSYTLQVEGKTVSKAAPDEEVTLNVSPLAGFVVTGVYFRNSSSKTNAATARQISSRAYQFVMPEGATEVYVTTERSTSALPVGQYTLNIVLDDQMAGDKSVVKITGSTKNSSGSTQKSFSSIGSSASQSVPQIAGKTDNTISTSFSAGNTVELNVEVLEPGMVISGFSVPEIIVPVDPTTTKKVPLAMTISEGTKYTSGSSDAKKFTFNPSSSDCTITIRVGRKESGSEIGQIPTGGSITIGGAQTQN